MNYTQTLRGMNCLKWLTIVLAAIYALATIIGAANGVFGYVHEHHHVPSDQVPLPALFAISGFVAAFIASVCGRVLSTENESHLPVVWTLPVSRTRYALSAFGTDGIVALAAFATTLFFAILLTATFGVLRLFVATPDSLAQLVRFLAFPAAMYGIVVAVSASTARAGRGLFGWVWLAMIILGAFAGTNLFPQPWHGLFVALDSLSPLAYTSYHATVGGGIVMVSGGPVSAWFQALSVWADVAALVVLSIMGLTAGIMQWRRVEA